MNRPARSTTIPKYILITVLLTVANLLILSIRNLLVGDQVFNFLKSNLFSGFLPLVIAFLLMQFFNRISTLVFWLGSLLWILLYPNSPYMISDLIHDSSDPKKVTDLIVYDTLIIFSIAMLSIFYGFLSLKIMYNLFREKYSKKAANIFIIVSLAASCPGFYIGRVIPAIFHNGNLYSWDLFLHPVLVINAIKTYLFPIGEHLPAYLMMLLFGAIQYMLLVMMKDINDIEDAEVITKTA